MGPALQAALYTQTLCMWALPLQLHSKTRLAQPPCWHSSGECCPWMGEDAVRGYNLSVAAPQKKVLGEMLGQPKHAASPVPGSQAGNCLLVFL